jgi:RNA polymerase sigma-70 factor (ECF subfamily)
MASKLNRNELSALDDAELVRLIVQERNQDGFGVIYDRYSNKVFRRCLSFCHDEMLAEDMAHDILLKLYLNLSKFNNRSKFSTWLYAMTYNYCVDYKRKVDREMKKYQEYAEEEQRLEGADADRDIIEMKIQTLKKLLDQLKPEDKALLLMKYQDDLPIKNDIMEITKLSESAVKMRLKRAKEKIVRLSKGR